MKQLIKKILREAVGVPTGITDSGKNIYEDLIDFLEGNPSYAIDGDTIELENKDGRYDFADFTSDYVNVEINVREIPHDEYVILGMGVAGRTNLNKKTLRLNMLDMDNIDIDIKVGYPENEEVDSNKVISLLKSDRVKIISSFVHEIKHRFDSIKKKSESVKERSIYNVFSNNRFGNEVVDQFMFDLYYMTLIESLVRPSEVQSEFEQMGVTQEKFLKALQSQETYKNLKRISEFSYEKFRDNLKQNMDFVDFVINSFQDEEQPKNDEEKIDLFLKGLYITINNNKLNYTRRYLSSDVNPFAALFGIFGGGQIKDDMIEEKEALFEKITKELRKYQNNPTKYFEKVISDNSREAQRMIRKLSKLYSLAKSEKEPKKSIRPEIALKEYDFLPEKRTKITNKKSF
jgi:hypothetical protein